jgi:hypothetical protein
LLTCCPFGVTLTAVRHNVKPAPLPDGSGWSDAD